MIETGSESYDFVVKRIMYYDGRESSTVTYSEAAWHNNYKSSIMAIWVLKGYIPLKDIVTIIARDIYNAPLDLQDTIVLHVRGQEEFRNVMTRTGSFLGTKIVEWWDEASGSPFSTCASCLRPVICGDGNSRQRTCLKGHNVRSLPCVFTSVITRAGRVVCFKKAEDQNVGLLREVKGEPPK